jgi:hypothetical protein
VDGTGEPADPRFLAEMAARDAFKEVCRIIKQARGAATALANGDAGAEYLKAVIDDVTTHLTNAEVAVNATAPHGVCPACEGEGRVAVFGGKRKGRCTCCSGRGWVTEALYNANIQAAAELDPEPPAEGSPEAQSAETADAAAGATSGDAA